MKTSNKLLLSAMVLVLVFITAMMITVKMHLKPKEEPKAAEPTSSLIIPANQTADTNNSFTWSDVLQVKEPEQEEIDVPVRNLKISALTSGINFFSIMTMLKHG